MSCICVDLKVKIEMQVFPINVEIYFWTVRENWSTRSRPTRT